MYQDNSQVPRMIHDALATENQTKLKKVEIKMNSNLQSLINVMPQTAAQPMEQRELNTQAPRIIKTPTQFNVVDTATGRSWMEDANGKRVSRMNFVSGSQLTRINPLRKKLGLDYLADRNTKMLTIDSASLMIDDLVHFESIIGEMNVYYQEQIRVLKETIESIVDNPQAQAQLLQQKQAERIKK